MLKSKQRTNVFTTILSQKNRFVNKQSTYRKMIFINFGNTERKRIYEIQYDETRYELV